ncbi:MAG: NAD(P)H-dependent flavin oxidoreductase, partial [Streptosporangiales bacterium]
PALAAAVSNAGGLGMLALTWTDLDRCRERIRATQQLTSQPFGVNVVLEWPQIDRLKVCLEENVGVVSTFWGDPAPYTEMSHQAGAIHVHTVGSAAEARRAVEVGVDAVVAQGWEAGGHVWGQVSTLALVPAVVDAVAPIPVLAAGGIGDGRGLAAVLALGAAAGWVGTRFLLATEAHVHPDYQARVAAAAETDTAYGVIFDGGWPDAPHRALRTSTVQAWEASGRPPAGRRPGEGDVIAAAGNGSELRRYGDDLPTPSTTGEVEAMALYAGQGCGLVHHSAPAAVITRTLADDAWAVVQTFRTSGRQYRRFSGGLACSWRWEGRVGRGPVAEVR